MTIIIPLRITQCDGKSGIQHNKTYGCNSGEINGQNKLDEFSDFFQRVFNYLPQVSGDCLHSLNKPNCSDAIMPFCTATSINAL